MAIIYTFVLALIFSISSCTKAKEEVRFPEEPVLSLHDEEELSQSDEATLEAQYIVSLMDDRELAGQVLMTGVDGTFLSPFMKKLLQDYKPGAIMLFKYNIGPDAMSVKSFLEECRSVSDLPLFIAVDHEGGLVHRFGDIVERMPAASDFWYMAQESGVEAALQRMEEIVYRSAQEIRSLGINMNLAPVAEILNDENRRFLETRSFGPDSGFTQMAVVTFVRGMKRAGVACVVKHFPGNDGSDPHKKLPVLEQTKEELKEMVKAFAFLIQEEEPDAIMLSHVIVSAFDPLHNASLSPAIVEWLRNELGFSGIILADDFSMAAVSEAGISFEDALIAGFNAGIDMAMTWPSMLAQSHNAIMDALESGVLSRSRLEEAAIRIVRAKGRQRQGKPCTP